MEAQWFNVAEQAFSQYSFSKKLWGRDTETSLSVADKAKPP
jgi:hypothetical protein